MFLNTAKRVDERLTSISASERVIPAARAKTLLRRTAMRDRADGKLRQVREQNLHEVTKLRGEAQRNGYEEGLALATQHMLWTRHEAQNVYRDAEKQMTELVMTTLERILGTLPQEVLTPKIVLKVVSELRQNCGDVTILVHPEMVTIVTEQLDVWNDGSATDLRFHIIGDEALGLLDCRMDCGENVIDAGLTIQLDAVRTVLNEIKLITDSHEI